MHQRPHPVGYRRRCREVSAKFGKRWVHLCRPVCGCDGYWRGDLGICGGISGGGEGFRVVGSGEVAVLEFGGGASWESG